MTNNRVGSGRLSGILLIAAAILSAHPRLVFSQDLESRSPFTLRSQDDSPPAPSQADKHMHLADDAVFAALPDTPMPQDQAQDRVQDESPSSPADSETHLNQFPVLPPGLTRAPLTIQDKFHIYTHKAFGPPAVILPAFGAGLGMVNPPSKNPKEWKDSAGRFGRHYGYRVAPHTRRNAAPILASNPLQQE